MIDLVLRIALLASVLLISLMTLAAVQRRTGRTDNASLPTGMVVVTGPDCRWCDRLLFALRLRGPDVAVRVLDHVDARERGLVVHSVPTVLVVSEDGNVTMRRSGPSSVREVDALLAHLALSSH
jgi:hypothetical protein